MTEDGERFYRIVLADVNGKATDEEAAWLRADIDAVREWRAVLVRMLQDAEAALAKIRADVDSKQTEAYLRGTDRAKDDFHRFKNERERERVGIIQQKAAIVERLKEAKDAIAAIAEHSSGDGNVTHRTLARLEEKLDRVLALLEKSS